MTAPKTPQGKTCILFALPEEQKPFLAGLRRVSDSADKALEINEPQIETDDDVVSVLEATSFTRRSVKPKLNWRTRLKFGVSGVGMKKAAQKARDLLQTGDVEALIICGFAGGLHPELEPGDLILADSVGVSNIAHLRYFPDSRMMNVAESLTTDDIPDVHIQLGSLVTTDCVVIHPEAKQKLAEATEAIAVDMETIGAIRAAQELGIPWLAVRAITDPVGESLPLDFNALSNHEGNVSYGKVFLAVLQRPAKIPALIQLGKRSTHAANNLAAFLLALLPRLPEGETDEE